MKIFNIKTFKRAVFSTFILLSASSTYAMSATSSNVFSIENKGDIPLTFSVSTGVLNGKSKEYVYDNFLGPDQKVSQLTWDLENIIMVGAETSIEVADNVSLNLGAWFNANEGSGMMSDYDWRTGEDEPWTDYSEHSIDLEEGMMLDGNLDVVIIERDNYSLSTVFGFRHDKFRWNAYNGSGVYSSRYIAYDKPYGYPFEPYEEQFRMQDVEFFGKNISYEQELFVPYIGFNFNYMKNRWRFNSYLRGSLWAWGEAEDTHYYPPGRYTLNSDFLDNDGNILGEEGDYMDSSEGSPYTFKDEVDNMGYLSFGFGLDYLFTESFVMGLSLDFQKYYRTEDENQNTIDPDYDPSYVYQSRGGMSHESYMITLSARYSL